MLHKDDQKAIAAEEKKELVSIDYLLLTGRDEPSIKLMVINGYGFYSKYPSKMRGVLFPFKEIQDDCKIVEFQKSDDDVEFPEINIVPSRLARPLKSALKSDKKNIGDEQKRLSITFSETVKMDDGSSETTNYRFLTKDKEILKLIKRSMQLFGNIEAMLISFAFSQEHWDKHASLRELGTFLQSIKPYDNYIKQLRNTAILSNKPAKDYYFPRITNVDLASTNYSRRQCTNNTININKWLSKQGKIYNDLFSIDRELMQQRLKNPTLKVLEKPPSFYQRFFSPDNPVSSILKIFIKCAEILCLLALFTFPLFYYHTLSRDNKNHSPGKK